MSVLWGENWLQVKEQSSSDCYCFFFQIAVWVRGDLVFCAETVRNGTGVRFEPALLLPGPLVRIVWCSPTPPSLFLLLHHHLKMPDLAADVGTVHLLLVCAWVVSLSIYKTKNTHTHYNTARYRSAWLRCIDFFYYHSIHCRDTILSHCYWEFPVIVFVQWLLHALVSGQNPIGVWLSLVQVSPTPTGFL